MTLLRSGSATDTGLVRSVNQDLAVETGTLFAVADGMGGHAGGEVAARLAVDTLTVAFGAKPTGAGLSEAVNEANRVVFEHSLDNPELPGHGHDPDRRRPGQRGRAGCDRPGQRGRLALVPVPRRAAEPDHRRPQPGRGDGPQRRDQRVRGRRPSPPPHPHPCPRGRRRRGRRPVADPARPGRPVPAVQRRPHQRARRAARSPRSWPPCPIPRWPPTCWCGPPAPTGGATTSPWSSSTSCVDDEDGRTPPTCRPWPRWPPTSGRRDARGARRGAGPPRADEDVEVLPGPEPLRPEVPRPVAGPAQGPPGRPGPATRSPSGRCCSW